MNCVKRLFLIGGLLAGSAALAQPGEQPDFIGVARIVAAQEGISVGEAVRRIKQQERIIKLQERLLKDDPQNFAGIEIVSDKTRYRARVNIRVPRRSSSRPSWMMPSYSRRASL